MFTLTRRLVTLAFIGVVASGCSSSERDASTVTDVATSTSSPAPVVTETGLQPDASVVVSAFAKAGLPVPDPRDNTAGSCPDIQCRQLITTSAISVYVFATEAPAVHFADVYGTEAHRDGLVVLSYAAARTPTADRPKYEKVLASLS